jgi:DNA-binding transcriptional LysR family regulator
MVDIAKLDLNLLVLFGAIAAARNVTRAAQRIGITQPSASKGLDRLRHLFKDQLFVRTARGMRPTALAMELEGPINHALATVREVVGRVRPFRPSEARGIVRIAISATEARPPRSASIRTAVIPPLTPNFIRACSTGAEQFSTACPI